MVDFDDMDFPEEVNESVIRGDLVNLNSYLMIQRETSILIHKAEEDYRKLDVRAKQAGRVLGGYRARKAELIDKLRYSYQESRDFLETGLVFATGGMGAYVSDMDFLSGVLTGISGLLIGKGIYKFYKEFQRKKYEVERVD